MKLTFSIEYRTSWGEEVRVIGSIPETPLQTTDGTHWSTTIELAMPMEKEIEYAYAIYANGILVRKEWDSTPRHLRLIGNEKRTYRINDSWKDVPKQRAFYSSAFTKCLFAGAQKEPIYKAYRKSIFIKANCPSLGNGYALAICGNQKCLGDWNLKKAVAMNGNRFPEWEIELDASKITYPLEYKFVTYCLDKKTGVEWEINPNRYLAEPSLSANETLVLSDRYAYFNLPDWKGVGVAIPIFSLKSTHSFGIGDFGDLKRMIDWAVLTHQKVVQILPINDTTMTHSWTDSYPYNSTSIYALHPIYMDISKMNKLIDKERMREFSMRQKTLNSYSALNYEEVEKCKWEYFHLIYAQEGEDTLHSKDFQSFFKLNEEWLQPYAVFCYLRELYHTANFRDWTKYAVYHQEEIERLCSPDKPDYKGIAFYFYLQYQLHLQLLEATAYARQNGIVLKGDIPIGINRDSVEAWVEPQYFKFDKQAGAPPDDFSVNGQNWGFPTYNWDVMEKDAYQWWMKRFRKMGEYFDAYRIDHILGFFRIWEIPTHAVHGLLGQFVPSLPMDVEEIAAFGLDFNKELFTTPYITEEFLQETFGPHCDEVKTTFVCNASIQGLYEMRPEFDTQRKVEAYFYGRNSADSDWIREGLYTLISDVLFLYDSKEFDKFHPRIAARNTAIYKSLSNENKKAFDELYEQYYYHRHNDFWYRQAMKKLPQLTSSTQMLVCGEDLGMIPECVAWVMKELQIVSLDIQRMPKSPSQEFGLPNEYPYLSVNTLSTHDMSTLRGWWQEDYQQTQRYFNDILGHYGTAPTIASAKLCEEIVRQQLYGNSMLCILSLQDWISIDEEYRNPDVDVERINIPSHPRHYWRYRMHLSIEELMKAESLNKKIQELVELTGRVL
ncbi:MAG: 4-alpha-glucanotransferase [Bacteroidaceae bacterium]